MFLARGVEAEPNLVPGKSIGGTRTDGILTFVAGASVDVINGRSNAPTKMLLKSAT